MPKDNKGWIFWKDDSPHANLAVNDAMLGGTTKLETLVRELIQNGADARRPGETARLLACDGQISVAQIKDYLMLDDLLQHIEGTKNFAQERNEGGRIIPKCDSQIALLNALTMRYFKFSDAGTKGIRGVSGYDENLAFWKLIFQEGTSDKGPESAGGVGVGKNATFPFSQLATVLYVTRTEEGYGLAGSAHLATSKIGSQRYQQRGNLIRYSSYDQVLQKIENADVKPLSVDDLQGIETDLFARNELGSDVIILGTNGNLALQDEEWPYQFAAYAIKNFYIAFKNSTIELTIRHEGIDDIVISGENCSEILDMLDEIQDPSSDLIIAKHDARLVMATYDGQNDNPLYAVVPHEDPTLGKVCLYLNSNLDSGEKQWCLFRSFGMRTVTRNPRPQKPVFGILVIETKDGSDCLLKAESGNHTEYDFQAMGQSAGEAAEKAIKSLEKWVNTEILSFGKVDTANTDIDLAGLSNFISLQDEIKTGDADGGTKPILELDKPTAKKNKPKKPKVRERRSDTPDREVPGNNGAKKEQWNHDDDHHKEWNHERETKDVHGDENEPEEQTYEREVNVRSTFRDVHDPFSDTIEVVGRIFSDSYRGKPIDIRVMAVDEQSKLNTFVPKIVSVKNLKTGENITGLESGNTIKNVLVGDGGYVHLEIVYETPFRGSLCESAVTTQTITVTKNTNKEQTEAK